MEEYRFINKVWISEKGRFLDKLLFLCGIVSLILNFIVFIMEGIKEVSITTLIFAIVMIGWSKTNMKRVGRYVESLCILNFSNNMLIWEYPELDMDNRREVVCAKYTVTAESIVDVALSHRMQSIRLACKPIIENTDSSGRKKMTNCQEKNKQCILIMYDEKVEYVQYLIQKYLNVQVNIVD